MSQKFLIVRPDNIGDLVLTTPLIRALRQKFPDAWIGALVNTYNVPVLHGNPHLNAVYAYQKLKHVDGLQKLSALASDIGLIARLRATRIDYALLASRGSEARSRRLAKLAGARRIISYADVDHLTTNAGPHEAEDVFRLAKAFDITGSPGPCEVFASPLEVEGAKKLLSNPQRPLVAIHISARKPSQRWPIDRYATLMHKIHEEHGASILLFWSPGKSDDKKHPGDDAAAEELLRSTVGLPVTAFPTRRLETLIAGLSLCDKMICSDGGAMHLAAALGKPIVCFFGQSEVARWHPWGVRFEVLQAPSLNATDVSIEAALSAYGRLSSSGSV